MTDGSGHSASFGYWVRRRRLALDLTQAALAARVGCATVTVKKIEHDQRRPSRQMAHRLAEALDIPPPERAQFVAMGRGERPVERPPGPDRSGAPTPPRPPLPAAQVVDPPPELPVVGRDRELDYLADHLQLALAGHGRTIFITGEAGRGKTALLTRFTQQALATHAELVVAQGNCTAAAGIGDPYLPFGDILLAMVGDLETRRQAAPMTGRQARRLWEFAPTVAETIAAAGAQLVDLLLPAASLRRWVTLPEPDPAPGDGRQSHLFDQLTAVLQSLARQRPLLLVIDDLQWADAASVGLLFHLGRRLAGSRVLLAGAYRPSEVAAAAGDGPGQTLQQTVLEFRRLFGDIVLDLEQFDPAAARRLSDAILDREPNRLPEAFRLRLFWQTRGHPLFLVELLREMKAAGHLVQDDAGRWKEGESPDWDALPTRVAAVIEQRLARLEKQARLVLEVASVVGERFTAETVAAVAALDEARVLRLLTRYLGRQHGLVQETGEQRVGDHRLSGYRFGHVLFQQYLYEALGEGERRRLHRQVAAQLERLYGDRPEPALAGLAHHYTAAGDGDKAVAYLLQAGDRARTLYAHQEAAEHYSRAVSFLQEGNDREALARTLMKLGLTYQVAFDYQRAQAVFDRAFNLWPRATRDVTAGQAPGPLPAPAPHPLRLLWLDPPSLDPTLGGYNMTAPVANQLFSGLVAYGPESEILPDVAYRWEIGDGGRRYLFHLRDDVFWSDGAPVTAHDFAVTYRRALDPATAAPVAGQLLQALRGAAAFHRGEHADPEQVGVRAIDDHTLQFELASPTAYFIHNLAYYVMLPVPRHAVAAHGPAWATPAHIVTNGPFRLAGWEPGRYMRLERNPRYHGPFTGNVAQVHLALDQPVDAQAALYAANELDVVSDWFAPLSTIIALRRRYPEEYVRRPSFVTSYAFMDVSRPPLSDRRVRQALAMAVNRRALAQDYLQGYAEAATGGFVPPGMPGHVPDCALPYDPAQARQLLAEAGSGAAGPFSRLTLLTTGFARALAPFVQESWSQLLGIDVALRFIRNLTDWQEAVARHHPVVGLGGWWADYPDPDNFLRVDVALSAPQWRHEGYQELLAQAGRLADQAERLQLYRQAEEILAREAPLVPLAYVPFHLMLKPWVTRYPTSAVKNPGFWKDVLLASH